MTERLYYRDAALLEFTALAVEHVGDDRHVVLDRTAFYPTSGGQPHDVGALGSARVIDVIEDDQRIVHLTDAAVPLGPVRGAVEPARRRDHMQQHTAQHLLSALAADRYNWETSSVHFGAEYSTIEFAVSAASDHQRAELQRWANDAVRDAREVSVTFEPAAVAEQSGLRKPSARSGEIRVVTIAGIDRSACGGTHVAATSAIGPVFLLDVEKLRGHVRIGFLAGDRVLAHTQDSDAMIAMLASELGCAKNQLVDTIGARQRESKGLREQLAALEHEVAASRVQSLHTAAQPGGDGLRRISYRGADHSPALLRSMAQAIGSLSRTAFVAIGGTPAALYFATSADSGIDAGAILKPALAAVGGRGGGSARVAQGSAPSAEALEQVANAVLA